MAESVYGFDKKGFDRVDRAVQAVEHGVLQPRPARLRQRRGGGGSDESTTNVTKFAIVSEGGFAVLLDVDFNPSIELSTGDPDYSSGAVDDAKIEFQSAHEFVTINVGRRVILSAGATIIPGSRLYDDNTLTTGKVIKANRVRALLTDPPLIDVQILGGSFEFQKKIDGSWTTYHTGEQCDT